MLPFVMWHRLEERTMRIFIAAALAVMLVGPAKAEPGPLGNWLMSQPVTLWDRGMDRADDAARRAAKFVGRDFRLDKDRQPTAYATYHWANNEIVLRMLVIGADGNPTHKRCNAFWRKFLFHLPAGQPSLAAAVSHWFSHHGYRQQDRDDNLGEKLARIVFVEVQFYGTKEDIECRGRLLDAEAASKPG